MRKVKICKRRDGEWHSHESLLASRVFFLSCVPLQLASFYSSDCYADHRYGGFQLSVENNLELLWFCFPMLCDWLKNLRHLLNQSDVKLKPILTWSHTFSGAWHCLLVFIGSLCCLHHHPSKCQVAQ